ncbi:MAG: methyltransferase domain-containing protein [Candidatus Omnitrophica bacterium]|nr:methyltransferase domain-containing protein [Candidatus Omnitrophota bacterium]
MINNVKAVLKRYIKEDSFLRVSLKIVYKFFIKCLNLPDYASELGFWRSWLPKNWERLSCQELQKIIFPKPLLIFINKLQNNGCGNLELLEIGSGPVSLLAWGVNKNLFHVVAIDALADSYEKIMKNYKYSYPIKPIKGYGERLPNVVNKKVFDIIYSSNALDHVVSPEKCLNNMFKVLKKRGGIFTWKDILMKVP